MDMTNTAVFVPNSVDNNISRYTRNTGTGLLTAIGTTATGTTPVSIVIIPTGASAYVACSGSNNIYGYDVGAGTLTPLGTPTYAAGTNPTVIRSSATPAIFVLNQGSDTVQSYSRNNGNHTLTSAGTIATGTSPVDMVVAPNSASIYVSDSGGSIYQYHLAGTTVTAATTPTISIGGTPGKMAVTPNNNFVYIVKTNNDTIDYFSRSGDLLTYVGTIPTPTSGPVTAAGINAIDISSNGVSMCVTYTTTKWVATYNLNTTTGAATLNSTPFRRTGNGPIGVHISPDLTSAYIVHNSDNTIGQYSRTP